MSDYGIPASNREEAADFLFRDEVKALRQKNAEALDAHNELNRHVLRTFSTPSGKKVFEWLWDQTMNVPAFDAQFGMEMGTAIGFARGGQQAMMMNIKNRMDQAMKEKK